MHHPQRIKSMSKPRFSFQTHSRPAACRFQGSRHRGRFQPNLGKDKDKLAEIIGDYDGLAIRSATKATPRSSRRPTAEGDRPRGIGVTMSRSGGYRQGHHRNEQPSGNSITTAEHAITLMLAGARNSAGRRLDSGRKWEKNRFMGVEITAKTLGVIGCGNIAPSSPTVRSACA